MWLKWLPWKLVIRRVARAHGFLDPIALTARLRKFSQPSEVAEPIELLRAGMVFHARGLINSRVIQHNLDWVWPYWIERQFDPADPSFVPRAFSITHINLTHRNWTAVGLPDCEDLPIVDPRGLVTPLLDGWSLDGWVLDARGPCLLPSRRLAAAQRLETDAEHGPVVVTDTEDQGGALHSRVWVQLAGPGPVCRIELTARAPGPGWLVAALRPCNPEGISFIHELALSADRREWSVNRDGRARFSRPADRHHVSRYRDGDVYVHLRDAVDRTEGRCDVGLATAAALFALDENGRGRIGIEIPLAPKPAKAPARPVGSWARSLDGRCRLRIAEPRIQFLYDTAVQTLLLHSPGDVYPGPYTYKRFWFRDAAFIIHALLCAGLDARAERALDRFPARQSPLGYFHSQDGEWDSNGEALWIMRRYCELTGRTPKPAWRRPIYQGAHWIDGKRRTERSDSPHAGLLPAGFSAEHLGPNDYYYWDDFWGIAGLEAAAWLAQAYGDAEQARGFGERAADFTAAVERSLAQVRARLGRPALPASPYRRLDSGAIGSLAAGYPLQLFDARDPRLLDTADFLLQHCFYGGGFFQDMTHSGINPYLTLHVAQVLLRGGDARCQDLLAAVAALASPTGQWPEAIHPRTGGGCMGDGQHVWAAAEWVLMLRNCLLREEGTALILAGGVPAHWLHGAEPLSFGPAPSSFGAVTLEIARPAGSGEAVIVCRAQWRKPPQRIEVRLPGFEPALLEQGPASEHLEWRVRPA